ncbi:beta-ketoacyl-ACP synthase III [Rhodovulum sp. DZ06]|uniref:beta-ketoacyl-ACP synthase III n=1 Tax=Rhodovulum sp. DZ06 TaxID=3425126 RepID=UPI003D34ED4F
MSVLRAAPVACGHYLPERVVENDEFTKTLDTSDEWIQARSGIKRRRFAAPHQKTSDLAAEAARDALAKAGMEASELDAIVLATATPDQTFPSTATRVQHEIGMKGGFAFDVAAVCAGFMYALSTANALIVTGQAKTVMVIGAETFSRIMDWSDRGTCVLFGDGAGALILTAEEGAGDKTDRGVLSVKLHSDGAYNNLLYVDGGPSTTQTAGFLRMEGRKVFQHAVTKLAEVAHEALDEIGAGSEEVDWLVPHQANSRIIESTAKKTGLPMEKVVMTVAEHGNTSAASIPLALSEWHARGLVKRGDLLLMEAIGGGLAWGAAAMRW